MMEGPTNGVEHFQAASSSILFTRRPVMSLQVRSAVDAYRRRLGRHLPILAGLPMLAGCGHALPLRIASCAEVTAPVIKLADDRRTANTRFSVLTHNIEGLGWPAPYGWGLAIVSCYPIVNNMVRAYGRRSCAGIDCLANKGILMARIAIPGVPFPIDLYKTHMNSRGASCAPARRNLAAHDRQAFEASDFINETHDDAIPLIFGGDFNMRDSQARWDNFMSRQPLMLVHKVCAQPESGCDVDMSWDGDDPWMDTQDLQFFWPGVSANIHPMRVEAMFDDGPGGLVLSDHDAFLGTYELRWPRTFTPSIPPVHPACSIFMPEALFGGAPDRRGWDDLETE